MTTDKIGLYLHIPFCLRKCSYCDFSSFSNVDSDTRAGYIAALVREIQTYKRDERIALNSVFFGGGTPSLLEPNELVKIHRAIEDTFDLDGDTEYTLEANPKTLSPDKLKAYIECGVNRISIGMQSIHENELKILGRIHSYDDFLKAYNMVSDAGINNINVDVMYSIPEQTPDSLRATLSAVASLRPTHISAYSLIIEENTPFYNQRDTLPLPSELEENKMYAILCDRLARWGYNHYEISNYARCGFESRHNLKYWRAEEYIGVGLSAYSYFNRHRYGNTSDLSEYLSENQRNYIYEEYIDRKSAEYEYAMLRLRLSEGFSLSDYQSRFGKSFLLGRREKIDEYIKMGYMKEEDGRISLTERGFYVSNTILSDLL